MRRLALLLWLLPATVLGDSRDPAEPAPLVRLGPPEAPGARVTPAGARVAIAPTRRSAHLEASWLMEAPPGPLTVTLPSSLFQVQLAQDGTPLAVEVLRAEAAQTGLLKEVRVDPGSGRVYARGPGAPAVGPVYLHRAQIVVPPGGRLLLGAAAVLSSGHDRRRWPRRAVEQTHLLHRRSDFFVYHFAVTGPGGPVQLERPPRTAAQARYEAGALRVAAAARRPFPLGLSAGLGLALASSDEGLRPLGLGRVSLDALLPWGHALALSVDGGVDPGQRHLVSGALVYQLYNPDLPFTIVPLGGHLDVGAALDLWPALRPGLRLGLGLHVSAIGLLLSADLFPERAPSPPGEAGPDRTLLRYRLGLLLSLSL